MFKQPNNVKIRSVINWVQLGMSYPMLAVLNVVELLKYWVMTYDADSSHASGSSFSQTETNAGS